MLRTARRVIVQIDFFFISFDILQFSLAAKPSGRKQRKLKGWPCYQAEFPYIESSVLNGINLCSDFKCQLHL